MGKKLALGLTALGATVGYMSREKIGSSVAYLIEDFMRGIYNYAKSYIPIISQNNSSAFNYWMEKMHPYNLKLGEDIVTLTLLTVGLPVGMALLGYYISKKVEG